LDPGRWQLLNQDLSMVQPVEWFPFVSRFHRPNASKTACTTNLCPGNLVHPQRNLHVVKAEEQVPVTSLLT
jgi:hypothetical protein